MNRATLDKLLESKRRFSELQPGSAAAAKLLHEAVTILQAENVVRHPVKASIVESLAYTKHSAEDYATAVELLEGYFAPPWSGPPLSYELSLLDHLDDAREALRRFVPTRGTCEACGKTEQKLTKIDSGDKICDECLKEFGPPSPAHCRASRWDIEKLRKAGLDVNDGASALDCWQGNQILLRREMGLPDDATYGNVQYAGGLLVSPANEPNPSIVHYGHINGFSAMLQTFTRTKATIAILCNGDVGPDLPFRAIRNAVNTTTP